MTDETDWMWVYENPKEAAAKIDRLRREVARLEDSIAMWRKHAYELGSLLNDDPGQGATE